MSRLAKNAEVLLLGVKDGMTDDKTVSGLSDEALALITSQAAVGWATLALAEEQRTANLLAWRAAIVGTVEHNQVSANIRERLDLPPLPKN